MVSIISLLIACNSSGSESKGYVKVLPKSQVQFPGTNSVCSLTIESSAEWTIAGGNNWCSVSPKEGVSGDRVVITVADNLEAKARTAKIVVTSEGAKKTIKIKQEPRIETSYVDVGIESDATDVEYNPNNGELKVKYLYGDMPDVERGNTIILSDEHMFDIRVVESVKTNGNTRTYTTSMGNMCNIFSNTSFTLASCEDVLDLNADGTPVITPVAMGYLDEDGRYVVLEGSLPSQYVAYNATSSAINQSLVAENRIMRKFDYDAEGSAPAPGKMASRQYYSEVVECGDAYEYDDEDYGYVDGDYYCDYDDGDYGYCYDDVEVDDTPCGMRREEYRSYTEFSVDDIISDLEWSYHKDFNGMTIYEGKAGRLWWDKCAFDASLGCMFEFRFGEDHGSSLFSKVSDLEYFSCILRGSFGADMLMRYRYDVSASYSDDDIIKHNVIPTQVYTYVVAGVPVHILLHTHLGRSVELGASGSIDASGGIDLDLAFEAGMVWSKEDGVSYIKEASSDMTIHHPTIQAAAEAHAKVSFYPQIEVGIYGMLGPWFEPRPYLKDEVNAGFRASTDGDNYVGWSSNLYTGLDMRVGLRLDFGFWDTDLFETSVFNLIDDTLLAASPQRLTIETPTSSSITLENATQSIDVEVNVESYNAITDNYSACKGVYVIFEADGGNLSQRFAISNHVGMARVRWTPYPRFHDRYPRALRVYICDGNGAIIDEETISVNTTDAESEDDYVVDLGLSVKWATCNVGANSPEEYGDYFAWGETSPKDSYTYTNCKTMYYKGMLSHGPTEVFEDISGNATYDAARANWGDGWRMPTMAEFMELIDNCTCREEKLNGVSGYRVTGPNGNSIFFPAAGYRLKRLLFSDDELFDEGHYCYYWSSTPEFLEDSRCPTNSNSLCCGPLYGWGKCSWHRYYRCYGLSVRPVLDYY